MHIEEPWNPVATFSSHISHRELGGFFYSSCSSSYNISFMIALFSFCNILWFWFPRFFHPSKIVIYFCGSKYGLEWRIMLRNVYLLFVDVMEFFGSVITFAQCRNKKFSYVDFFELYRCRYYFETPLFSLHTFSFVMVFMTNN